MDRGRISKRSFCIFSGLSGIVGVVLIIEVTFYISAWHTDPQMMPFISLKLISSRYHPRRSPWENSEYPANERGRGSTGGLKKFVDST